MINTRNFSIIFSMILCSLTACEHEHEEAHHHHHQIVVTTAKVGDIDIPEEFVCQIHSQNHIEIQAMETGYLEKINLKEGQEVKEKSELFRIIPAIYKAKWDSELAELRLAELEYVNAQKLFEQKVISDREVKLFEAKVARVQAKVKLAEAEFDFTIVKAPFDGIVDRMMRQAGSLVKEGEVLTTLSDNSKMWAYFNVPEKRYLAYMKKNNNSVGGEIVTLRLADDSIYKFPGKITAIEADFNNETGNISFRADFSNPIRLLRHGQTGKLILTENHKNAIIIPQRATFPILDKQYVYVIGEDHIVKQRRIIIEHELDDIFIIKSGLKADEHFILDGIQHVRDGDHVEYTVQPIEEVLKHLKNHAE
ncbi:MAG: efflux RND transporter periplasmic adaptor subunit [Zavarzinella sp.]